MATPLRRTLGALGALVLALLVVAGTARTADAADGYKYWNYFHVEGGKYAFAQTGPADFTPKDGTVEAYRYGLSTAADGLPPRTDATTYTVEDICAGTRARERREAGRGAASTTAPPPTPTAARPRPSRAPPAPRCRPPRTASRCSTRSPTCGSTRASPAASTATRPRAAR